MTLEYVQIDVIFTDFAKAFDTVPHTNAYSYIQIGMVWHSWYCKNWISSFLNGRTQCVILVVRSCRVSLGYLINDKNTLEKVQRCAA